MLHNDARIVLTLDAGGTNFVFSAIQRFREVVRPVLLPSNAYNLDKCLKTIVEGFSSVKNQLAEEPAAISFAFPGPADYENGIIGDLPNLSSFRGGIALGPYLKEKLGIPVFINNDGNLFAYGEALAGALPEINRQLLQEGSSIRYKNLLAVTLGTGFGGGVVINNDILLIGDNGCGGDVWCTANKYDNQLIVEESVSIRAVQRSYANYSGDPEKLQPKEIFEIAEGRKPGNREAAIKSFEELGAAAGFTIAEALNIVDGIVVIGGGIAHAHKYILPAMVAEMNGSRQMKTGEKFLRVQMKVFNLMDEDQHAAFLKDESTEVTILGTDNKVSYHSSKKTGVTVSNLGTSRAVALGAYAFALHKLQTSS